MNPTLIIHPDKLSLVQKGHPWIYPKAILTQAACQTGQLVDIMTAQGDYVGTGIYNEHSLYRVRVLARAGEPFETRTLPSILNARLKDARMLRKQLALPNDITTAFRLLNSEGDGLSGLTIDQFGDVLVVSSAAYWVELHRALIVACLTDLLPKHTIHWLSQTKTLKQDGWESEAPSVTAPPPLVVKEYDVQFHIDFTSAQKTGLYLDQRDNHQLIASLAKGKSVLDLYTYTGGFALHAAKHGATRVVAIDSSKAAIAQATINADLNGLSQIEWLAQDATKSLALAGDFDIVILDPPKLMPSRKAQNQAKNYYRFLHRELFKAMKPHTIFLSCNCSSALRPTEFTELIYQQALSVGKTARILSVRGPACCHPTIPVFPEGQYLTSVLGILLG